MARKKKVMITLIDPMTDKELDKLLSELDKMYGYQFSLDNLNLIVRERKSEEDLNNVYTGKLFDIKPETIPVSRSQIC